MPEQENVRSDVLSRVKGDVDNFVSPKHNRRMKNRLIAKPKKAKEKLNQFGKPLAKAVPTMIYAWKCSECGSIMPYTGDKPPVRCSNRKGGCGRIFYNEGAT